MERGQRGEVYMECKNCDRVFDDNFCPNCGQKAIAGRLDIKHILKSFFKLYVSFDKGFFKLFKDLFTKPAIVIQEYINGKRIKYFNPFQYFLITIGALLYIIIKYDLGTQLADSESIQGDVSSFRTQFISFFYDKFNILELALVPLLSIFTYLFFRSSGYNFTENLVLNIFVSAQKNIIIIFTSIFMILFQPYAAMIGKINILLYSVYFIWVYSVFFKTGKPGGRIVKSLLVLISYFLSSIVLVVIVFYFIF